MTFGSEQDPLLFVWKGPPAVNSLIIADVIFSFYLLELEDDTLYYAISVDQLVGCGVWKDDNHENMSPFELFAILVGLRMESFAGIRPFKEATSPRRVRRAEKKRHAFGYSSVGLSKGGTIGWAKGAQDKWRTR